MQVEREAELDLEEVWSHQGSLRPGALQACFPERRAHGGGVRIWSFETNEYVTRLDNPLHGVFLNSLTWSDDGRLLLAWGTNLGRLVLVVVDPDSGETVHTIDYQDDPELCYVPGCVLLSEPNVLLVNCEHQLMRWDLNAEVPVPQRVACERVYVLRCSGPASLNEPVLPRALRDSRRVHGSAASTAALARAVRQEIQRLGGRLTKSAESPGSFADVPNARVPLPRAMHQLTNDVRWPEGRLFAGTFGDWKVWMVDLSLGGHGGPEGHRAIAFNAWYVIGQYDRGNYSLLVDLEDEKPTDPKVYMTSHDDRDALRPTHIAWSLSEFLASLEVESH